MRACGHVATYIAGCRCEACTEAHTDWQRDRRSVRPPMRDYQLPTIPWQGREWCERAACRGHPRPDWWFPVDAHPRVIELALRICAGCPVRSDCAEAATSEKHGIWAGEIHRLSIADRKRYLAWRTTQ